MSGTRKSSAGAEAGLREKLRDYERLHHILQIICSSLRVEEILQRTIKETTRLCHADQGAILLFEPDGGGLMQTLVRQQASAQPLLDHTLNSILAGWVSRHKRALLTHDLESTLGSTAVGEKYRTIGSAIAAPLMVRGKLIGVINCITTSASPPLGERELHLLQLLAPLCAQFIANARLHEQLFREADRLRRDVQEKYTFHGMIGRSEKMQRVFALVERVIPTDGRVLLEGESGTGKELVARIIHYNGPRKNGPFVAVDCGALPASLLESELFGHVKGAFTGALQDKKGLFEEAHGGTLFLDEIVNMPPEIQAKFLRVIQENEIRPVGSTRARKIDVRIIAAASGHLREQVEAGRFRQDLYFRLNVVNILLPPLRDRKEDIPLLVAHFLQKLNARHHRNITGLKPETLAYLEAYHWPGNVRELENVIERMVILAGEDETQLSSALLPEEIVQARRPSHEMRGTTTGSGSMAEARNELEKSLLLDALRNCNWNQAAAARELGISERTVRYKMKKFGLRKPERAGRIG